MTDIVSLAIRSAFEGAEQYAQAGGALRELAGNVSETEKEIRLLDAEFKKLSSLEKLTTNLDATGNALSHAKREVAFLRESMVKAGDGGAKLFAKDLERAKKDVTTLADKQRKLTAELAESTRALQKSGTFTRDLATSKQRLQKEMDRAGQKARQLQGGLRGVGASAQRAAGQVGALDRSMERTGRSAGRLKGFLGVLGAATVGRELIEAHKAAESLAKGFELITGSSQEAAQEIAFAKQVADDLGVSAASTADAYLSLSAASRGTALEGQATRDIFVSVTNAMSRLGKSSADTEGALQAVQQMISKGKVSAEELRGQLGERLPGAFQAAARSIGVTTGELDKMLQSGQLTAEQLLPALSAELDKTFKTKEKAEGFAKSWERLKNALSQGGSSALKVSGIMDRLAKSMDLIATVARFASVGFTVLVENIKAASTAFGAFIDFVSGDLEWAEFKKKSTDAFETADQAIAKTADSTFILKKRLDDVGSAAKDAGRKTKEGMQQGIEATQTQKDHFKLMSLELQNLSKEDIPAYLGQLGVLFANGDLAEQHFISLSNGADHMGKAIKDAGAAVEDFSQKIARAGNSNELLEGLDALSQAYANGEISQQTYRAGMKQVAQQTEETTGKTQTNTKATQKAAMEEKAKTKATEEAKEAMAELNATTDTAGSLAAALAKHMAALRQEMQSISEGALVQFDAAISAAGSRLATTLDATRGLTSGMPQLATEAEKVGAQIEEVDDTIGRLIDALNEGNTAVGNWFIQTQLAAQRVKRAYLEAKQSAMAMADQLGDLDTASAAVVQQAQGMVDSYTILDDQTLSKLQREVDRLTRANDQLSESIERSLRKYQDLVDRQAGNELAIAQREQTEALTDLERQLGAARASGNADLIRQAEQAIAAARRYHAEELARLKERLAGEKAITRERSRQAGKDTPDAVSAPADRALPARAGNGGTDARPLVPADTRLPARLQPVDTEPVARVIEPAMRLMRDLLANPVPAQAVISETELDRALERRDRLMR